MTNIVDGGDAFSSFDDTPPGYAGTYTVSTHTVQEVIVAAKRQFGDDAGAQVEDTDIIRWINDAQDTIVNRNRVIKARSSVSAIPGVASYRFPEERIRQVEGIHYDGRLVPNADFTTAQQHMLMDGHSTEQGNPILWYEFAGQFTFWPAPKEDKEITLYLTLKPTPVTSATDLLAVPDQYFPDVLRFVLMQAYELDEDWDGVQVKQQQFDASINDLGEEERTAQHQTYSTINVVD